MRGEQQRRRGWLLGAVVALVWMATPAEAQEAGRALTAPRSSAPTVSVVPAATQGIDPIVGEHVTTRMLLSAQAMGYLLVDSAAVEAAQAALSMPPGPDAGPLFQLGYATRSARAISARVYAQQGRYVVELLVASMDGHGPFRVSAQAGADDLHGVVDALVRQALPPPSAWDAAAAERIAAGASAAPPAVFAAGAAPPAPVPPLPAHRWGVVLQTEAAIGVAEHDFYNHLVGARLDLHITRAIALGAYLGYVNLEGRAERVGSLVAMLALEDRIRISGVRGLSVVLRGAGGYVANNGAIVRLSAGVNLAIGEHFELGLDVLAPTFWQTRSRWGVSFDPALELHYRFGAALTR